MKKLKRLIAIYLTVVMILPVAGFSEEEAELPAAGVVTETAENANTGYAGEVASQESAPEPEPEPDSEADTELGTEAVEDAVESGEDAESEENADFGHDQGDETPEDAGISDDGAPSRGDDISAPEKFTPAPAEQLAEALGVTTAELARLMGEREEALLALSEGQMANLYEGARVRGMVVSDLLIDVEGTLIGYRGKQTELAVPEGVREIADEAFKGHAQLLAVKLPASVRRVGKRAFEGCAKLEKIVIASPKPGTDEGLREIGERAFANCINLAKIELPETLEKIGDEVFRDCARLQVFELPEAVSSVGRDVFGGCAELKNAEKETSAENGVSPVKESSAVEETPLVEAEEAWPILMLPAALTMPESVTLGVGESATLPLDFVPAFDGDELTIKSDDAKIAAATKVTNKATGAISVKITGKSANTTVVRAVTTSGATAECTVTVMKAPGKVTLSQTKATLGSGEVLEFSAALPEGTTSKLTVGTSKAAIAAVEQTEPGKFKVTAGKTGTATITVKTFNGKTAKFTATVKKAPTAAAGMLTIKPTTVTLAEGQKATLKATYKSGFGGGYTWNVVNGEDGGEVGLENGVLTAVKAGTATVTVTSYNGLATASCPVTIEAGPAVVTLNASEATLGIGETFQLKPTAVDEKERPVTLATYTYTVESDPAGAVVVDKKGKVTAKKACTATVTATAENGVHARCAVTVKSAPTAVKITNNPKTLGVNEPWTLVAAISAKDKKGNLLDCAGAVTFSSSKASVLAVDKSTGVLTAKKSGSAKITAKAYNGKSASVTITVKKAPTAVAGMLTIKPTTVTLAEGQKATLKATYKSGFGGGYTWNVINGEDGGEVSLENGVLTAVKAGTATVTVTSYNGLATASCPVTIEAGPAVVTLNASEATLGIGETLQLKPTAVDEKERPVTLATYTYTVESDPAGTVVVDKKGKVTAKKVGTATVTATAENGVNARCAVTVKKAPSKVTLKPAKATLGSGEVLEFTAMLPDGTASNLTVSTSKAAVAAVEQAEPGKFRVTAGKTGKATITVRTFNGKTAKFTATVKSAPEGIGIDESVQLGVGQTYTLKAAFEPVGADCYEKYVSGDEGVVTVTEAGVLTAVGIGHTTVQVETYNGHSDSCEVTVYAAPTKLEITNPVAKLGVKEKYQLHVACDSDEALLQYCTWKSSNAAVLAVGTKTGLLTAKKAGKATITATMAALPGKPTAKLNITVVKAPGKVTIAPASVTLRRGETAQLTATLPKNTASQITWTSEDDAIASVENGLVTALSSGTTTITATTFNGKQGSCVVTVEGLTAPTVWINGEAAGTEPIEVNSSVTLTWGYADTGLLNYEVLVEDENGSKLLELKNTKEVSAQLPKEKLKSGGHYRVRVAAWVQDIEDVVQVIREASFIYVDPSACYSWEVVDGGVKITDYSGKGGSVIVPEELGGKSVVRIGTGAFNGANCAQITDISWPTGVVFEEDSVAGLTGCADANGFLVFDSILCEYFGSAAEVTIPPNVICVNDGAFKGNTKLESVKIPNIVQTIGARAFANCTNLKNMENY